MAAAFLPKDKRVILVPIDDSDDAEKSVGWALQNLYRPGGSDVVYFLHVVPERQYDIIGGDAAETIVNEDVEAERRAVENAKEFIKHRVLEKIEAQKVPHQVEIVRFRTDTESVGAVITERAATLNAAAVVMAKHQQGAIRAFFVGSATNYVANHCKQPVVVLH